MGKKLSFFLSFFLLLLSLSSIFFSFFLLLLYQTIDTDQYRELCVCSCWGGCMDGWMVGWGTNDERILRKLSVTKTFLYLSKSYLSKTILSKTIYPKTLSILTKYG